MTISKNMFKQLFTAVSKRVEDFDQFKTSKNKLVFAANGIFPSKEAGLRRGLFIVIYEEIDEQPPQFIFSNKN